RRAHRSARIHCRSSGKAGERFRFRIHQRAACTRSGMKSFCVFLILLGTSSFAAEPTMIGSKKFTESYVLGEIATRTLNEAGIPAQHRQGMGGTIILWQALRGGQDRKSTRLNSSHRCI